MKRNFAKTKRPGSTACNLVTLPRRHIRVADVVLAYWFKRRAERAHFEALKAHIEGAGDRLAVQVNADINRLFHDKASGHHCTYGTTRACGGGPRTSRSDKPEDATLPSELIGAPGRQALQGLRSPWRSTGGI